MSTISTVLIKTVTLGAVGYTSPLLITSSGAVDGPNGAGQNNLGSGTAGSLGVDIAMAGIVTNDGAVTGGRGYGSSNGTSGSNGGAAVSITTGTFVNNGHVTGGQGQGIFATPGAGGAGIILASGTLINTGTITGGSGGASEFGNHVGATGAAVTVASGLFIDSGTINGNVVFGAGASTLEVEAGASFSGTVTGGTGSVLELGGTGGNILVGIGGSISNFKNISFLPGVTGALGGNIAGLASGETITGFTFGDEIGISDFTATSDSFVSGTGLVLKNAAGATETIDLAGMGANPQFTVGSFPGYGTFIEQVPVYTLSSSLANGITLTAAGQYRSPFTITSSGTISTSQRAGVYSTMAAASLSNAGMINETYSNSSNTGVAVGLFGIGTVANTGTIMSSDGTGVALFGGTVSNSGGTAVIFGEQIGVAAFLDPATVINSGIIAGLAVAGVYLRDGGTLMNSGTIAGEAYAVRLGGSGSRLVIDPGAAFYGNVGAETAGVLELAAGTGNAVNALYGVGNQFNGFTDFVFDGGSHWDLSGTSLGLADSETISGFMQGDTLAITDFAATQVSYINGTGLVLSNAGSSETLHINALTGGFFTFTSDGVGTTLTAQAGAPAIETISTALSQSVTMNAAPYDHVLSITGTGSVRAPAGPHGAYNPNYAPGFPGGAGGTALTGPGADMISNAGTLIGGAGGGGSGGGEFGYNAGGGGGAGGDGITLGATSTLTNGNFIAGGGGGTAGAGRISGGGAGGAGGIGVAASQDQLNNSNTVLGGAGGVGGYSQTETGSPAGAGGSAISGAGDSLHNSGTVIGGAGGYGGGGYSGGNSGGAGGNGFTSFSDGTLNNLGGIFGGAGGSGGATNNGVQGGAAGAGGAGVEAQVSGSLNNAGMILGGAGGAGGQSDYDGGTGGAGGDGLIADGTVYFGNHGRLAGAAGGAGGLDNDRGSSSGASGGAGGTGATINAATLYNGGLITGGAGGAPFRDRSGGVGGDAVASTNGTLINYGTLTGGSGGLGGDGDDGSSNGAAGGDGFDSVSGGTLSNDGIITGGAGGAGQQNGDGGAGGGNAGAGGAGVAAHDGGSFVNNNEITGGTGGIGALAYLYGGGGGAGGDGLDEAGGASFVNNGDLSGGAGGPGESPNNAPAGGGDNGDGGAGGAGAYVSFATLNNTDFISGGDGGRPGANSPASADGAGGVGVLLNGGTLINAGLIEGGVGANNGPQADAVLFGADVGTLDVKSGALFFGDVVANARVADVLELSGGAGAALGGIGTSINGFSLFDFDAAAAWTLSGTSAGFEADTITGFGTLDGLDVTNLSPAATQASLLTLDGNDVLNIAEAGGGTLSLTFASAAFDNFTLTADGSGGTLIQEVTCFTPGTRILTPGGEVLVETMRAGDLVVTMDGRILPVRWVGTKLVSRRFCDPLKMLPIRLHAGCLDDGVPTRDLLVSPDHAMFVDGILIQAAALVNGGSIIRETDMPEAFTYYHLEVAEQALILAEGAPAESFVDNIDRMAFDNWAEYQALFGSAIAVAEMAYPRAKAARQIPRSIRDRLLARAAIGVGHALAA